MRVVGETAVIGLSKQGRGLFIFKMVGANIISYKVMNLRR
jgi:hypothetical protein